MNKRLIVGIFTGLSIAVGILTWNFLQQGPAKELARFKLRIATPGFQSSALVVLAQELGFFKQEGIDSTLVFKSTGRECLNLVIDHQADFAVVFETPIVHAVLAGHKIEILTELHRSDRNTAIIVRKDHGIRAAKDLVGKTVVVVPKTNAEFLLDLFIRSHLVDPASVILLKLPLAQAIKEISDGTVDAAALWEPHVSQLMAKSSGSYLRFQSSYYSEFSVLARLQEDIKPNDEMPFAILRSLFRAQLFYRQNGPQARRLVEKKLQSLGFSVSDETWDNLSIEIGLSSTLLTMLKEEAKWYGLHDAKSVPIDMHSLLGSQYLKSVAPRQVTYE